MKTHVISTALKGHFLRLYQIAFSDDNFDVLEMRMLYRFAEDRGISKEALNDVLLNPSHQTVIPEELSQKVAYLYDLAIMIWADGKVTEDEHIALKKYCIKFGFMEDHIEELTRFLLEKARDGMPLEILLEQIKTM
ncbi:hypothetical protein SAMN02927921_01555 [Sinomicrobium oceani]|uniref:Tellurite resistance protein TerB n=1 Tax=Sinomicrobium oceani TaxID=1150368 RepID=A0A1K1P4A8_9FLAO|nr:hypothetical protein [Sinomicrobium oceani]SFW41534.1 hypothetical protein SAMN02927921_01555 [Sinomicrobium oceani]